MRWGKTTEVIHMPKRVKKDWKLTTTSSSSEAKCKVISIWRRCSGSSRGLVRYLGPASAGCSYAITTSIFDPKGERMLENGLPQILKKIKHFKNWDKNERFP
jgi:hypothetical protein